MHRFLAAAIAIAVLALSACASQPNRPVAAAPAPPAAAEAATQPAPLADLVKAVDIPYESFTLANGLRVLVHTDRKAPVVAVSVWYGVGSKHEPKGKTGFAHLFEHLMFNGSENAPGDFFEPLQQVGATDINGTTWFDRTNYFETVPTGALDRALMLESDRMGHLLGAVTQEKLTNQIGVVQNEKRQGDNQPYGLVEYEQLENLYPAGHPYHHSTIGSMADLSRPRSADVKQWFSDNYGPNNAVLVLAGDIDAATARAKVEKWFGDIPGGPGDQAGRMRRCRRCGAPRAKTIKDQVATTRIYRMWADPGPRQSRLPAAADERAGAGRPRQLAARRCAGAAGPAGGGGFGRCADLRPGRAVRGLCRRQAGDRSGGDRGGARRRDRRLPRRGPERGRIAPRRHGLRHRARSARSNRSAASAARRRRWPKGCSIRAIPITTAKRLNARPC